MRPVILVIGIILLIGGIIGYAKTDEIMSACESEASKAGLFASEYRQGCDVLSMIKYLMPTTTVIGLGLMGYSIVTKQKIKVAKPVQEKIPDSLTDNYIRMAKRFEELSEKHNHLEKRHAHLMAYLKRNGIEIPDHIIIDT